MMKKFMGKIKNKLNDMAGRAKMLAVSKRGEGYIDTAVKAIIGVVIGGLILTLLYTLFKTNVFSTIATKIGEMFNYSGT